MEGENLICSQSWSFGGRIKMQFRRNVYCRKALGILEVWERYMEEAHEDEKMFENIKNEKKVGNKRTWNV